MRFFAVVALCVAFAAGTLLVAWWTVPAIGLVWGLAAGRMRGHAWRAALAAALAWLVLLVVDAAGGPLLGLGTLFGAVARVPSAAFFALTLAFPALLAWSAAALGGSVWPRSTPARREPQYVPASQVLGDR